MSLPYNQNDPNLASSAARKSLTVHGTGGASVEELARNEEFWRIKRSGQLSYQGVHPDALLESNEALIAIHKSTGAMRVQQHSMALSDSQVLERVTPRLNQALRELGRNVMKAGHTKSGAGMVAKAAVRIAKSL